MTATARQSSPVRASAGHVPGRAPGTATRVARALATALVCGGLSAPGSGTESPALQSLPSLSVAPYLGTWYQVAWFPNRFQAQCLADTTATYRQRADGGLDVLNRCRTARGGIDEATGLARPVGRFSEGQLEPAQLEVSFLPAWLRWTGLGWGRYWVIDLAPDGRYAVVSEPSRQYLWVLSRSPVLAAADADAIRQRLGGSGFDLTRWQDHPHRAP
jgi:apolipoprotein D and lipocalin family protein